MPGMTTVEYLETPETPRELAYGLLLWPTRRSRRTSRVVRDLLLALAPFVRDRMCALNPENCL